MYRILPIVTLFLCSSLAFAQQPKAESTVQSEIVVELPDKEAELLIEDIPSKATGLIRKFQTPPLEIGGTYVYKFTIKWRPNNYTIITRNREQTFLAGQNLTVDMTTKDPDDSIVIRYVPTPDDIVAKMVELAKITKEDVVYEPGCGDARMVVAAVKSGAKRGVGIDIDPERVTEAKKTVADANLQDKVEIRQGDALKIKDLENASVVMMYMGNEFNMQIRPILWSTLKPGSRVVSHRFLFGDWKPDQSLTVRGKDGDDYEIHLWTITDAEKVMAKPAEVP